MSIEFAENRYGKCRVRLVKVERHAARHDLKDVSVDIHLSGNFAAAYLEGDNSQVVPTDTMKNTVYALARRQPLGEIEEFGQRLAEHLVSRNPQVSEARIDISQNTWSRIPCDGQEHDYAFVRASEEQRTATVLRDRSGFTVKAGIADLVVLKTSRSAFEGFARDEYTTLKETRDRLLGTAIRAEWTYAPGSHDFGALWHKARTAILEVFATHDSRGVQHTLYATGKTVLERIPEATRIELSMPNRHCLLVDLTAFGLDNPNEVFVPTDEPYGLIEAVLTRS
jgi:urate oxidase